MKFIKYIALTLLIVIASSCDLELQDDPNAIKLEQINPTLILNRIQINFATFFNTASTFGMQMTRMQNSGGADYPNTNQPTAFDGLWTNAYANILNDIYVLKPIAEAQGLTRHLAIAQTIEAYVLLTLVDYFGKVPYSEAFNGLNNPNPKADEQVDLYNKAIELLNKAKRNFGLAPNPSGAVAFDFYYGGTGASWVRLVNSLKLKLFLNLRVTSPTSAQDSIVRVLNDVGGLITAQTQNFVFRYATNTADPDSRHPRWINNWLTGANDYIANYLMWQMNWGYNVQDPRMRYYFYRQTTANNTNPNNIRCILEQVPAHYPNTGPVAGPGGFPPSIDRNATNAAWGRTFCFPTAAGYWGRDHVDPQGIPPDGLLRTTWGAYPVGGRFDANNGLAVTNATTLANSMRGAGIQPIMMRSFVNFMIAEADLYLTLPAAFEGTARTQFENGIRNSIADVRDWTVNGTYGSNGFGPSPTQAATIQAFTGHDNTAFNASVNDYVTRALTFSDTSPVPIPMGYDALVGASQPVNELMNLVAREYWIALYGNGVEAYNLIRRTGFPRGMQPAIAPNPGKFPRTFWYPVVYEARNANATQKPNQEGTVFWDNASSNLDY
ncbi:MAG: SusD/RagB family nutrient-binding outer membrane lipoprotein [Flammeovirgaceae bacterium]|jgi:hypothetical protein|nr:SusD/RagB family nutrient-binding outer membrane lipoprotein [Flammeovirgaceae bacterium]